MFAVKSGSHTRGRASFPRGKFAFTPPRPLAGRGIGATPSQVHNIVKPAQPLGVAGGQHRTASATVALQRARATERGFDFLDYGFSPAGLALAAKTIGNFIGSTAEENSRPFQKNELAELIF
jgi:hypothetical protein